MRILLLSGKTLKKREENNNKTNWKGEVLDPSCCYTMCMDI